MIAKSAPPTNMTIATARKLAGNATAGDLLHRIAYWHPHAKIARPAFGPHKWSVLTRQQWAHQAGISVDQYSRWLPVLKSLRLIVARKAVFDGQICVWIRLLPRAIGCMDGANIHVKSILAGANMQGGQFAPASTTDLHLNLLSKENLKSGELNALADSGSGVVKVKSGKTVAELLAERALRPKPKMLSVQPKFIWRDAWTEAYPKTFFQSLTIEEVGRLNKACHQIPKEHVSATINWALLNWNAFCNWAAKDKGAFPLPQMPTIGFFQKHIGVACNHMLEAQEDAEIVKKPSQVKMSAPAPAPVKKPINPNMIPATKEQVLAILFGDDD